MKSINEIILAAKEAASLGSARTIAVAAAHDEEVIFSVAMARREGIARAILIGDKKKIEKRLAHLGESAKDYEILSAKDDAECAQLAVQCVYEGKAELLMKGLLPTSDLLRAVLAPEKGLRTGSLLSHVMLYEPENHKMMGLTDGGINTFPDLEKKADILENAAKVFCALGYESIYAACICGAEGVNPKIQSTVDAEALSLMTERWEPYHMSVYGPVGLDLAVSKEACRHKGYEAPGAGEADILLVPSYETGNGIGKALSLFGGAKNAGIVVGAKAPIVLVSRSDSAKSKLASIALGSIICASER